MRTHELRYRLLQNLAGIIGSVALIYSVCSPDWYGGKGLWHTADLSQPETQLGNGLSTAVETERVFGVIASMMAVTAICLCLLFIFCWDPNTCSESKVNPGRMLHPGKLLLVILMPTALLYLVTWSSFTSRHEEQIRNDITKLGSAYWMGICSWFTLLVILPIICLIEQCTLPEPETNLNKSSVLQENI